MDIPLKEMKEYWERQGFMWISPRIKENKKKSRNTDYDDMRHAHGSMPKKKSA